MSSEKWSATNYFGTLPDLSKPFDLPVEPNTDVWAKPPSLDVYNAPFLHRSLKHSSLSTIRATITAPWKYQYDQGGIMVAIVSPTGPRRWVKCGVEMLDGTARVGTVARDNWADWSLHPIVASDGKTATVEFVNKVGDALWIYLIGEDGKRWPLREVAWWAGVEAEAEFHIGVYGAAPGKDGGLEVKFSDVKIKEN
ncbi:Hypothetical protein D9617_29g006660 [Elsinoe fawcettii]|nr:Hypothetical protein D9617_29g006660 [Elsinoe fawcettii]